jgi:hypothetical protein
VQAVAATVPWLQKRLQEQPPVVVSKTERLCFQGLSEADEGTRTLDLLHGKDLS